MRGTKKPTVDVAEYSSKLPLLRINKRCTHKLLAKRHRRFNWASVYQMTVQRNIFIRKQPANQYEGMTATSFNFELCVLRQEFGRTIFDARIVSLGIRNCVGGRPRGCLDQHFQPRGAVKAMAGCDLLKMTTPFWVTVQQLPDKHLTDGFYNLKNGAYRS